MSAAEIFISILPMDARHSQSIRAITFDIGGTLIEPWPSVGHVYSEVAARHGHRIPPETLNRQFATAWKAKKNFRHTSSDWSNLVDQTFAGLVNAPPSATFFPELYEQFTSATCWRVFDDVLPCFENLRRSGIPLGVISNWDERLRPLLRALGLDKYFEVIVVSIETGHPKPDPRIFAAASAQLKTAPSSILHVGDSLADDFEGAKCAGFQSLLLNRSRSGSSNAVLHSLAALRSICEGVSSGTKSQHG